MTTGNQSEDTTFNVTFDGVVYTVPQFRTRVWNGLDYPHQKPEYTNVYSPSPYGSKYPGVHRYRKYVKPPKRARTQDHTYSSDYSNLHQVFLMYSFTGQPIRGSTTNGLFNIGQLNPYIWQANDELALLGRLRDSIQGSDFNLAVFLAEGHESLTMIADAATRIYKSLYAFRKGNFWLASKILYGVDHYPKIRGRFQQPSAQRWLELQYGWRPLVQDIYSGAQSLAHQMSAPLQTSVSVRKRHVTSPASSVHPSFGMKFEREGNVTSVNYKAIIREVSVPALVGLTDPASVVWEKLPYSFVCDWVIPVGSYLSARGLSQAVSGTFVRSERWKAYRSDPLYGGSNPRLYNGTSWFYREDKGYLHRTIQSNIQVPFPNMKTLGQAASWQHCANAVALLVGARDRIGKKLGFDADGNLHD